MSNPTDESRWKTSAMIRAEIDLDEAALQVDEALARAEEMSFDNPPLSDEDVERFEQAARDPNAPDQMKQLAKRVDEGSFTWRDVAEGKVMRDPDVRAAFAEAGKHVDMTPIQQGAEMLKQGMSPAEVAEALRGDAPSSASEDTAEDTAPTPEPPRRGRPREEVDDDDYFGGSFMERGW